MTDISLKNRIIALVSFAFTAVILAVRSAQPFTLVLFGCMGIVIFFSDKILNSEKFKHRTTVAFFVFGACYQTFFQIFNRLYDNNKQLMTASAFALFIAGVFAATDIKKLPYSILAAPLICILDIRIAAAYCLLLLSFSIVKVQLQVNGNKSGKKRNKNKSKKKFRDGKEKSDTNPFLIIIISIIVSAVCLGFCFYCAFKNGVVVEESLDYPLRFFKNIFGFSLTIIFLAIKLLKSKINIRTKVNIIAGVILNIVTIPLYFINYGWCFFSLFIISITMFLVLVCLENQKITDSIKEGFHNHKYLFLIGLLLLLQ